MFELFQPTHLIFVLVVALVVLGPRRLAETGRSLGRTIRSIQEYKDEFKEGLLGDRPGEDGPTGKHTGKGHPSTGKGEVPPTKKEALAQEKANDKDKESEGRGGG